MDPADWKVRLEAAIAESGKTQREISLAAGLGPGYLHSIFTEGKEPTLQNVLKICAAANISAISVIGGFDMSPETEELVRRATAAPDEVKQSLLHVLNHLAQPREETPTPPNGPPRPTGPRRP